MAPLIGMDAPLGRAVCCPLPGHEESSPSAAIDPKSFVFQDFHERGERSWHTLQEVYASLRYGEVRCFTPGSLESGVWAARLAFDAGLLDVDALELPELRLDGLSRSHRAVGEGFAVNYAFNRHHHPDRPAVM
jgi:hypothetical protein